MTKSSDSILPPVIGHVSVFNRKKQPPLPFETKHIRLDWSKCDENETAEILSLLPPRLKATEPLDLHEKKITMSVGRDRPIFPIARYRNKFRYLDREEFGSLFQSIPSPIQLSFNTNYVETEDSKPITEVEVMEFVSGTKDPIILGNLHSVQRLGPQAATNVYAWDAKSLAIVQHFLNVVWYLYQSPWYREPIELSHKVLPDSSTEELPSTFPKLHSFAAAAPFLRQLYDQRGLDDLLRRTREMYLYFCGDRRKAFWIRHEIDSALSMIKQEPFAMGMDGITNKLLFDAVLYGCRLMHASPNSGAVEEAKLLIDKFGAGQVAYAAHAGFKHFFGHCVLAAFAINQDFRHWVDVQKLPLVNDDLTSALFGTI